MATKTFKKIVFYSFSLLVLMLPAVFWLGLESIFSLAKMSFLYLITDFLLICFMLHWLRIGKVEIHKSTWQTYVLFFLLSALLSSVFSINFFSSLFGTEDIFLGFITIIHVVILGGIFVNFFPKEKVALLLLISVFGAGVIAFYSLLQFYGFVKFTDISWTQNPGSRAFGSLGHPNHLAAYLIFNIALGVGLVFLYRQKLIRFFLAISAMLMLYSLLLTGSRGAFLALVVAMLLQFFFILRRQKRIIKYVVVGVVGIAIIGAAVLPFLQKTPLFSRLEQTLQTGNSISGWDRLSWWKSSWEIYLDYPVLGSGLSTFPDIYNEYRRTDYRVQGDLQDTITPEAAHNEFVNTLATQGVLGLTAFILLFGYPLRLLFQHLRKKTIKDGEFYLLTALLGAVITALLQTQFNFWVVTTFTFFYLALAAVCLLCDKQKKINLKLGQYYFVAIGVATLFFVLFSLWYVCGRLKAEYFLQKGDAAILAQDKEKFYERGILSFPWEYSYHTKYADYALLSIINSRPDMDFKKYIHLTMSYYDDALMLNAHHPVVWGNYGVALLTYANYQNALGNKDGKTEYQKQGIEAFAYAADRAINNPFFTYHFALALEKAGLQNMAVDYYKKTLLIRPDYMDTGERLEKLNLS